ncbi:hypothetical protein AHAS_Ahas13G0142400 [Arachis hypogaea]
MKELNPNFFFEIDVDDNHSLRNVFWADAMCRAAWECFGDVVTFDTTYKTNRYDMPFGSFCMEKAPICVITDQCLQMRFALKTTLPNTRHKWCIWHILKKISHKLVGYRRCDQLNTCMKRIVFESKSNDSFERDWHDFIEEYDLYNSR